jgi:hypothetical protein
MRRAGFREGRKYCRKEGNKERRKESWQTFARIAGRR